MKRPARSLQRITSQQLRSFEAVARLGSVTRAAAEMHVTQPTVSVQIRDLTRAVGEPLFETVGRRPRLTQAGETLQRTAAEISACWLRFESSLAELRGLVRGRLRIAAVTTAEYFVPQLVGPFAAEHPGVEIQLAVENRDRVVERLYQGQDDVSIMMLPPADVPLETTPIRDNPLVVIAPASHPLVGRRVRLSQLAAERWLMREPGSGTRLVAERQFRDAGFVPKVVMSLGSNEAIKHGVAAGLGVAVVSRLAVEASVPVGARGAASLAILEVSHFPIRRRWSAVWRSDQPQTLAARRFVTYLEGSGTA